MRYFESLRKNFNFNLSNLNDLKDIPYFSKPLDRDFLRKERRTHIVEWVYKIKGCLRKIYLLLNFVYLKHPWTFTHILILMCIYCNHNHTRKQIETSIFRYIILIMGKDRFKRFVSCLQSMSPIAKIEIAIAIPIFIEICDRDPDRHLKNDRRSRSRS